MSAIPTIKSLQGGRLLEQEFVVRTVRQEPDESLLDAIGNQHNLETAIADLIDNSIEYGGSEVVVQLITTEEEIKILRVVDNGQGMAPEVLDEAMQLRKKTYTDTSLSYFGMGMKMASLSQAGQLRVFTKSERGETSGAQIRRADAGGAFNVEFLSKAFSTQEFQSFRREAPGSGTIIEWQRIDNLPISQNPKDRKRFLEETIRRINTHLGLTFHRFISEGQVKIFVEIWDQPSQQVGIRTPAKAVDPFGFRSPNQNYPQNFSGRTADRTRVEIFCAIVPPNSDSESVRIGNASLEALSGFYVYRNRRLVQAGGWQNVTPKSSKDLQLGRVRIELTDSLIQAGLKLTAEKTTVKFSPEIQKAIASAKSIQLGKSFEDYLSEVELLRRSSNKRLRALKPTTRLEGDENQALKRTLEQIVGFQAGSSHITILSTALRSDQVFELDLEMSTLKINAALFDEDGPLASEIGYEFFKTTLYFLFEGHFLKSQLTKSTYSKIEQIHRVLAISLGIQSLDADDYESPIIGSPAMLANFSKPRLSGSANSPEPQEISLNFKSVWSSESNSNKSESFKKLLEGWRSKPAMDPDGAKSESAAKPPDNEATVAPAFTRDKELAHLGIEVWKSYKKHHDVALVGQELSRSDNEVVAVLAQLILRFEGKLDNRDEVWQPDEPFSSSERDRLVAKFKDGQDLDRLSVETGRTCLHIAKEILDSPKFNPKIPSSMLKKLGNASS
jgi:anti-sigma regulatory factor (Ser/Thr protein kinase)